MINNMKKFCEAHSGLSALLVEKSKYDGIWVSSLTHATSKGLPDNELVPLTERVDLVRDIKRITTKPILVDVDTLGGIEHVPFYIKAFKESGAWGIVIEDKKYPKQNSLLEENKHQLEDVDVFCQKIRLAKSHAGDMKIIARLESLIAKHSMADALIRAQAYEEAGADLILIHSKQKIDATEVMEFARRFGEISNRAMVAIPTTYELPEKHPFSVIIHANHMLRASMKAMEKYINGEQVELSSVQELFDLCGH
jgi:2-methylisocitrate lyase-like PEP mutase family enzyme